MQCRVQLQINCTLVDQSESSNSALHMITSRIAINPVPSYSTRSAAPSIDLKTKCMFCGYKKHNNDKHLVQIQYEHAIQKLKERCREKRDVQFEARIGENFSNLPALDAKYHRSCYTMYMKDHQHNKDVQESVHDVCFNILVDYMDPLLFEGRALDTQTLLNRYKSHLKEKNYEMYDSYTPQKLRTRILNHYGSRICITEEINRPPCTYNSGTLIGDVINIAAKHKQMLKGKDMIIENPDINEEKILQRAAVILLNEINEVETIPIHPLNPDDVCAEKVATVVPQKLKTFLDLVCNGCCRGFTNKDRKVCSISQDIISVNSNGKKRMPKNIGLALSLKNSIRSKEFINYLNNLGHCISYDDFSALKLHGRLH